MPKYGFNFQWMYTGETGVEPENPDERALDFMANYGFNFVRIPANYRFWTKEYNYFQPDEKVFVYLDQYLEACRTRGFQMSLNLHRAPGYCINRNDLERDNLWLDQVAQDAFVFLWETFAIRYKGVPNNFLNFDLLNEPPEIGQYGMTRENHSALIKRTVAAIRAIDPDREITIDGLDGGSIAMPELADLGLVHSGRGYQPMPVSHFEASWWPGHAGLPAPIYPGTNWKGHLWNRQVLFEHYKPWREVEAAGAKIHIGEFGCYNKTPNDVALRWFGDLFDVFNEFGWGYGMWNFEGPFGIIEHGRAGVKYEEIMSYKVDRDLLDLMINSRCDHD